MPPKGPSHESQRHVNTHAFVPGRNIKLKEKDKAALAAAFSAACAGCCARCAGQLAWKQKYGKFKAAAPGAGPRRCNTCQLLTVRASYHHTCRPCAASRRICAKCSSAVDAPPPPDADAGAAAAEDLAQQLANMRERERRAAKRALERGLHPLAPAGQRGGEEEEEEGESEPESEEEEEG